MSVRGARWAGILAPVLAASAAWSVSPEIDRVRGALEAPTPAARAVVGTRHVPAPPARLATPPGSLSDLSETGTPALQNAFMRHYLLPQMTRRLGSVAPVVGAPAFLEQPLDSAWRGQVVDTVERDAGRALKRAVRRWAADRMNVEIRLPGRGPGDGRSEAEGLPGRTRIGFGIAHLTPRLILERSAGAGAVRGTIDLRGRMGVDWSTGRGGDATVRAGVDPRDGRFDLALATSF